MRGENRTINFICACIPGVGFLYNGLYKKGISFIVLWFFIINVGGFFHLSFITSILSIPIWFYCFFKTFDVNKKVLRGEPVEDEFLFVGENFNSESKGKLIKYFGIALVVIGVLSILRNLFEDFFIHMNIYRFLHPYIVPLIFIVIGIYIIIETFRKR